MRWRARRATPRSLFFAAVRRACAGPRASAPARPPPGAFPRCRPSARGRPAGPRRGRCASAARRRSPLSALRATSMRTASGQALRGKACRDGGIVRRRGEHRAERRGERRPNGGLRFRREGAGERFDAPEHRCAAARRTSGAGSEVMSCAISPESAGNAATPCTRCAGSACSCSAEREKIRVIMAFTSERSIQQIRRRILVGQDPRASRPAGLHLEERQQPFLAHAETPRAAPPRRPHCGRAPRDPGNPSARTRITRLPRFNR